MNFAATRNNHGIEFFEATLHLCVRNVEAFLVLGNKSKTPSDLGGTGEGLHRLLDSFVRSGELDGVCTSEEGCGWRIIS